MKKLLIATHGNFASGVKSTLKFILGDVADVTCIDAYVNPDENLLVTLEEYFSAVVPEDEVIVMTDIKGGSVNQKVAPFGVHKNVFIVTGFNLPLLIALALAPKGIQAADIKLMIEEARGQMELVELDGKAEVDDNFFT